jgi:TPR repeat protein
MTISPFQRFLVTADKVMDYIPIASTVNNLVDLFLKVFRSKPVEETAKPSHYIKHIKEKNHCAILLIPVIGNVFKIYDVLTTEKKQEPPKELPKPEESQVTSPKTTVKEPETETKQRETTKPPPKVQAKVTPTPNELDYERALSLEFSSGRTPEDLTHAFYLYRNAAENGYLPAMLALAEKLYTGSDLGIINKELSHHYAQMALSTGDPQALCFIAKAHEKGNYGYPVNNRAAREMYKAAADQGSSEACIAIGGIFENQEKDFESALFWYEKAAVMNDSKARRLVQSTCKKLLVPVASKNSEAKKAFEDASSLELTKQHPQEAFNLYKKAAEGGYVPALIHLADEFEMGWLGLQIDKNESHRYAKLAIESNTREGFSFAGLVYSIGKCGYPRDINEAKKMYTKAADLGDSNACIRLGSILQYMEHNPKEAFAWYEKAVIRNDHLYINQAKQLLEECKKTFTSDIGH